MNEMPEYTLNNYEGIRYHQESIIYHTALFKCYGYIYNPSAEEEAIRELLSCPIKNSNVLIKEIDEDQ